MATHSRDTLSEALLAALPESHVLVLPGPAGSDGDALVAVWKAARDEAMLAYQVWSEAPGADELAVVYRAAADREEAAAQALASRAFERRTRWPRLLKSDKR